MNGGTTQPAEPIKAAVTGIVGKVVTSVLTTLLIGALLWVWKLDSRIVAVERDAATTAKFWQIHAQTRDAINDDRAAAGKPLFKWDID